MSEAERQTMLDKSIPTVTSYESAPRDRVVSPAVLTDFTRSVGHGGNEFGANAVGRSTGNRKVVVEMLYVDDECYEVESDGETYGSRCRLNGTAAATAPSIGCGNCESDVERSRPSTTTTNGGFRLLRAYRRKRKQKPSSTKSFVVSSSVPEDAVQQTITIEDSADDRLAVAENVDKSPTLGSIPEWKMKLSRFAQRSIYYGKKLAAFLLSTLGLAVSMVAYAILGGFLFSALESPYEVQVKSGVRDSLQWHVEALWNETQKFNVLHPVDWTVMATKVLHNYTVAVYLATTKNGFDGHVVLDSSGPADEVYTDLKWSFAGALLFSITVITTIGYGHIAPKTPTGRLMTILYATIGIPLTLLALAHIGGFLATVFRFIYKNILTDILLPLLRHFLVVVTLPFRRCVRRLSGRAYVDDDEPEVVDRRSSGTPSGNVTSKNDTGLYDDIPEVVIITGSDPGTPSCAGSSKKLPISADHSDVSISDWQRTTENECDPNTRKEDEGGTDCVDVFISGDDGTRFPAADSQTASSAIRKSLRKRKEAALRGVQQTYDMFFTWRRGVTRALYNDNNQQVRVPVHVSILLISGYIVLGSMMFGLWEPDWNLLIGSYFCFITLSTIGFGDYVPGTSLDSSAETAKLVLCSMYLVIGMAMLAMCFELMQEEARQAFRGIGRMLGLLEDEQPPQNVDQLGAEVSTSDDDGAYASEPPPPPIANEYCHQRNSGQQVLPPSE